MPVTVLFKVNLDLDLWFWVSIKRFNEEVLFLLVVALSMLFGITKMAVWWLRWARDWIEGVKYNDTLPRKTDIVCTHLTLCYIREEVVNADMTVHPILATICQI